MTTNSHTASTQKVRGESTGGKRGEGRELQLQGRRRRRPDPRRIGVIANAPSLTGVAGLVGFGSFLRRLEVDRELRAGFAHLKEHPAVVYPMPAQLRLLLGATV